MSQERLNFRGELLAAALVLAACGGVGGSSTGDTETAGSSTAITNITLTITPTEAEPTTTTITTGPVPDLGGDDSSVCADADVKFEPQIPTVLLLIDQSGSMTTKFGGVDRWQAVYNALLDPQTGLVPELQDKVRFGMALYTSFGGFQGGECPVITATPPALNNYAAIAASYEASEPEGETPTGESIAAVTPTLVMDPSEGPKVIVLATDGEPDTCAQPNPQNGQQESVDAAAAAFAQGVRTYVISVGAEVSDKHLQDVANAGAGVGPGDPDAPFYKANDPQALAQAFAEIVEGVRDCKLSLNGKVAEGGEGECSVSVNGSPVPFGDADGWQLNNPSEVELVGDACDAIQSGEVQVSIKCSCGFFEPIG